MPILDKKMYRLKLRSTSCVCDVAAQRAKYCTRLASYCEVPATGTCIAELIEFGEDGSLVRIQLSDLVVVTFFEVAPIKVNDLVLRLARRLRAHRVIFIWDRVIALWALL